MQIFSSAYTNCNDDSCDIEVATPKVAESCKYNSFVHVSVPVPPIKNWFGPVMSNYSLRNSSSSGWFDNEEDADLACLHTLVVKVDIEPPLTGCGDREPTRSEDLQPTGSEDPLPTGSEDPLPTGSEDPRPIGSEDPLPTGSEDPRPIGSEDPQPTGSEDPQPIGSGDPLPTGSEDPRPFGSEDPRPIRSEDPQPTGSEDPQPIGSEDPQPTGSEEHQMISKNKDSRFIPSASEMMFDQPSGSLLLTYSTFKVSTHSSGSPDYISPSPESSIGSGLLTIYPTRKSFVERNSFLASSDSTDNCSLLDSSSIRAGVLSDSDAPSERDLEEGTLDDVLLPDVIAELGNCSQSTLVTDAHPILPAEMPKFNTTYLTTGVLGSIDARKKLISEEIPRRSKSLSRCSSAPCGGYRSFPDALKRDTPSSPSWKRHSQCSAEVTERSFLGFQECSEKSLQLSSVNLVKTECIVQAAPCVFPEFHTDPHGLDAPPKATQLSDKHTIQHKFVFSSSTSPSPLSHSKRSSFKSSPSTLCGPQSTVSKEGKHSADAPITTASHSSSPKKRFSKWTSFTAISTFFHNAFKRRTSVRSEIVQEGTAPLTDNLH